MTAFLLLLKRVPLWVWVALGLLIAVWFYGQHQFDAGQADRQKEWDASIERGRAEVARLTSEAGKVTVRTETKVVEKIVTIKEKARAIETVREVFVPVDSGSLPGGFRLFYDAAITGSIPDTASITDAASVPIADVADTHAKNAELCRIAYATVEGWQSWAAAQAAVK